jgi:cobalamin biosynthesis protein CbiG
MRKLILGAGCRRNVSFTELKSSLLLFLEKNGIESDEITLLASCDLKSDEIGLLELARFLDVAIKFFPKEDLNRVAVPNPSAKVEGKIGTSSVAEAAAILAGSGQLLVEKHKYGNLTFAIAAV